MIDKLIVSNKRALRAKYGASGFRRIQAALHRLIAADRRRGLVSAIVYLDHPHTLRAHRGKPVSEASDHAATKRAIDSLHRAMKPDYVTIVGAADVVCHQPLRNPLYAPPDDPDRYAWSDLPYACESAHSNDIADFSGPTRVVGRIPDLAGAIRASDAAYLTRLLGIAARHRSRPPDAYVDYFALSARSWAQSSRRNVFAIFGRDENLRTCPPSGPRFGDAALGALAHFINCHGDEGSPEFQGQYYRNYPIALATRRIDGRIAEGTIAVAECCYGAQLYNAGLIGVDILICQSYLHQGAYGYFGSTTIAYGESRSIDAADSIVQFFLLAVLDGASIGRAALAARQRYVRENADLSPTDLKTLAQFTLLGDPSIHPLQSPEAAHLPRGFDPITSQRMRRRERRAKLALDGMLLKASRPTASQGRTVRAMSPDVERSLASIAKETGIVSPARFRVFQVKRPSGKKSATAPSASHYFVAVQKPSHAGPGPHAIAVVAKQMHGRIVDVQTFEQR